MDKECEQVEIGTPLQITVENEENDGEQYRSKLIDKNSKYLIIDYPTNVTTKRTAILPLQSRLKISFIDKNRRVYQFETTLIKRVKTSKILGLAVVYPEKDEIKRIQRRNYVRIHTSIDVAIHSPNSSFLPIITVTNDISGGGLSIIVPEDTELESGMEAEVWMVLPRNNGKNDYICAKSETVDLFEEKDEPMKASFKFVDIDENDKQRIIRFVFDKQREERRKEYL